MGDTEIRDILELKNLIRQLGEVRDIKKILFITSSSINGGAQKHIRDMFLALTNKGLEVYLVAPSGWLTEELSFYKENIYIMESKLKNARKLQVIIDKIKPDIINTFILSGGCFGYLAWLKRKYGKIFITVNNPVIYDGISKINKLIYPFLYKWMAKYCSAFLTKSKAIQDELSNIIEKKRKVISIKNGIDFSAFNKDGEYEDIKSELGIPADTIIITNVAALDRRKGQCYLIDAAKNIIREYGNIYFLIVGDGEEREILSSKIKSFGLEERVKLLGKRNDINRILYYTDIFVLCSLHEGLPNALMEAMSMGLPCIATDVGGVSELISDSKLGIVIQPKSSKKIEEAIRFLIDKPEISLTFREEAYKKMKCNYELNVIAEELLQIYETV